VNSKWLTLGTRILRSNVGRLASPYKLTYCVTRRCDSRCTFCSIWKQKSEDELALDEIRQFAEATPSLSWVDFTGGEPTLRPDFVEIIAAFLEHCPGLIFVHFPTNGLRTDHVTHVCSKVVALRPPRFVVSVSLDGPPELNDLLRGVEGGFARAAQTYARLRSMKGVDAYVGMTLHAQNVDVVEETVAAIRKTVPDFGYGDLHVNLAHVSPHYYGNADGGDTQPDTSGGEIASALRDIMKKRGWRASPFKMVERRFQKLALRYLATGKCPRDCAALMASCFLGEEGTVYPCSIWDKPLGNIRDTEYSLQPLVKSDEAARLRKVLLAKRCPNCWTPCEAYPTLAANLLSGASWRST
jgi:MoaA/NifB/PqqE/SkfB family radical SAM enzyme